MKITRIDSPIYQLYTLFAAASALSLMVSALVIFLTCCAIPPLPSESEQSSIHSGTAAILWDPAPLEASKVCFIVVMECVAPMLRCVEFQPQEALWREFGGFPWVWDPAWICLAGTEPFGQTVMLWQSNGRIIWPLGNWLAVLDPDVAVGTWTGTADPSPLDTGALCGVPGLTLQIDVSVDSWTDRFGVDWIGLDVPTRFRGP